MGYSLRSIGLLDALWDFGPSLVGALAEYTERSPATTGAELHALERRGHVDRCRATREWRLTVEGFLFLEEWTSPWQ